MGASLDPFGGALGLECNATHVDEDDIVACVGEDCHNLWTESWDHIRLTIFQKTQQRVFFPT